MFDGKVRGNRAVSSGGKKRESDKGEFLEKTRKQREDRAAERKRLLAIVKLQSFARRCLIRKAVIAKFKLEMFKKVSDINRIRSAFRLRDSQFNVPLDVLLPIFRTFLFIFGNDEALITSASDGVGLEGITAVLQLFLDSLQVTLPAQFNPFLRATDELADLNGTNMHRPWEYQISELTRVSISLIGIFFDSEMISGCSERAIKREEAFNCVADIAVQVLHSVLEFQIPSDSPATTVPNTDCKGPFNYASTADSGVIKCDDVHSAIKYPSSVSNGKKFGRDADSLLCSIARYSSKCCTNTLRLCITKTKVKRMVVQNDQFSSYINFSNRVASLLLAFIQQSVRNLELPKAMFRVSRNQNVRNFIPKFYIIIFLT